jgi:hypothetical protein
MVTDALLSAINQQVWREQAMRQRFVDRGWIAGPHADGFELGACGDAASAG